MEKEKKTKVRGYLKPDDSFRTLQEWESAAYSFLELQGRGFDTRSGFAGCKKSPCSVEDEEAFLSMLEEYFKYQLQDEVDRWELLTMKNVLDFIEDFVNHRVWAIRRSYSSYFSDIGRLRFAFFYSRGDMEPYVLLDDEFTMQIYGSLNNVKKVHHYTTVQGAQRIQDQIDAGPSFDISAFTAMDRPFFRPESNIILEIAGNVRAGFRSDIKSMAVDSGRRACNMHRLEYPGEKSNLCYDLSECDGPLETTLWNEYIVTPIKILGFKTVEM